MRDGALSGEALLDGSLLDEAAELVAAWDFETARDLLDALIDADPHPWDALRLRAIVRRELGDLPGALADAERAADGADARYGAGDPDTVRALAVVGMVRHDLGDWDVAEVLYHQVLDSGVDEDGPAGRAVHLTRANFALLQRDRGDQAMALILLNAAYAVHRREYGPDDLDTVRIAAELADAHRAAGDIPAARRLFAVAHAGASTRLGETHPFTRSIEEELEAVEPVMPALLPISAPPSPSRHRWLRRNPSAPPSDDDESPIGRIPTGPLNTAHPPTWPLTSPAAGNRLPPDTHREAPVEPRNSRPGAGTSRPGGPIPDQPGPHGWGAGDSRSKWAGADGSRSEWAGRGDSRAEWSDADGAQAGWAGAGESRAERAGADGSRAEWAGRGDARAEWSDADDAQAECAGESPAERAGADGSGRERAGAEDSRAEWSAPDGARSEWRGSAEAWAGGARVARPDGDATRVEWPDEEPATGGSSRHSAREGAGVHRRSDDVRVEWPVDEVSQAEQLDEEASQADWPDEDEGWSGEESSQAGWPVVSQARLRRPADEPSRVEWPDDIRASDGVLRRNEDQSLGGARSRVEWSGENQPPGRGPSQVEWPDGDQPAGHGGSRVGPSAEAPTPDGDRSHVGSSEGRQARVEVSGDARGRTSTPAEDPPRADQLPAERRPVEHRPADQRAAEHRPVERRPVEHRPVELPLEELPTAEWPDEDPTRTQVRPRAPWPPVDTSRDEDWASGEWPVEEQAGTGAPTDGQTWAADEQPQRADAKRPQEKDAQRPQKEDAQWPPEENAQWSPVDRPRPAGGWPDFTSTVDWSEATSTVDRVGSESLVDKAVGATDGWWGPGVKPASPVPWQKLLIFGLSALVAVVVGVVAIYLVAPGRRGVRPAAVATSAVSVPLEVRLVDGGESLTVMWAAQPTDVVVALTGAGSAPTVLAQLPPGATSYVVRGVDRTAQYCVVVGPVVDGAPLSAATSVCTRR